MKDIEATIPDPSVRAAIDQLRKLGINEITVSPVKVYRTDVHQTMVHRGCTYEEDFTCESKLQFHVHDQDAVQAETILAHAMHRAPVPAGRP